MSFKLVKRATISQLIFLVHYVFGSSPYKIPNVRIQALRPIGFRASIPDAPKVTLFAFYGNVNKEIGSTDVGTISVVETTPLSGRWVVQDFNLELKVGDVIKYHVSVTVDGKEYLADNLSYVITELEDPYISIQSLNLPPVNDCQPTRTKVIGTRACAGHTVFEENFDILHDDIWRIEQYNPVFHLEEPFITYQKSRVTTEDGYLVIRPTPQQHEPGFDEESIHSGGLDLLHGCTAPSDQCTVRAYLHDIIPPVASGKITSKQFAFTYGTVHVRAKLPLGDWLYPEILLEPFAKKYGTHDYASGVLKIATARGNKQLSSDSKDYSNRILYGGALMDSDCRDVLLRNKTSARKWSDDFHEYSLRWEPERITLSVDGEEWGKIEPPRYRLLTSSFDENCSRVPLWELFGGTDLAPFDDHFQVSLGVAAGGSTEFPQNASTGDGYPKPWDNTSPGAQFKFWKDMSMWLPTWVQPELKIDYIKVVAL